MTARSGLEERLGGALKGEVRFDRFSRGRYATDASHYQVMPVAVATPRHAADMAAALEIARDCGVSVLARGGGTSQCGQAVNESLVLDTTRHVNRIIEIDAANRRCIVEPGIVLDELNRALKPHGLWFPVDVSTASRATLGGMAGNNSCGTRSIRFGLMRDHVLAIDALLADGTQVRFGPVERAKADGLFGDMLALGEREAGEIADRFPKVLRRVGGYNLDALVPNGPTNNLAHLLVGSEGTLALATRLELKLSPLLPAKLVGVCHFGRFYEAMDAAQHLVTLGPVAVELVDSTMIALARDIPLYRATVERFVRGRPDALLTVEFAEDDPAENARRLKRLGELMGDLGFGWDKAGAHWGGVVEVHEPELQAAITTVRQSGLNIMMSMKQEGKPVSFVEDCAVPLEHLADYTARLTDVFEKHGTRGTWYAHASVGCLHVRPILNLRLEKDVRAMRAIAEEAFELVRGYGGSHSGEHGDGIVRSEFHERMFGTRMVGLFQEVKDRFDPAGMLNPGRIVRPPRMDDRRLLRYRPDYHVADRQMVLDWSAWPGAAGGFQGAVEMCNNNGACRKLSGGVMCPSYRATLDERDVTRGRANTLRLAISGQLGPDALTADGVLETLKLCVSCKGCRRECPTGVDMARMKIEVLHARAREHGLDWRDRLVAWLPRYAPYGARLAPLLNLRDQLPGAAAVSERLFGFSARRKLPRWRRDSYRAPAGFNQDGSPPGGGPHPDPPLRGGREQKDAPSLPSPPSCAGKGGGTGGGVRLTDANLTSSRSSDGRDVVLLADTFNRYFEPENLVSAHAVLSAAGYRVIEASPQGERPLCCGRTFLAAGLVDEARHEARRLLDACLPHAELGTAIVGLEPSCLLGLRDEIPVMLPGDAAQTLAGRAMLFEEVLATEADADRLSLPLRAMPGKALLHGHCHQKAFDAMGAVEKVLRLIPELEVETVQSSCCGMAGAFGYQAETYEVSMKMAELSLAPAVRAAHADTMIVADGTSCRQQIEHATGRNARHVARVLYDAMRR